MQFIKIYLTSAKQPLIYIITQKHKTLIIKINHNIFLNHFFDEQPVALHKSPL